MTVGELRAALEGLPQDALVVVRGVQGDCDEPYIDTASPPQPMTLAVKTIAAGPSAGQFWLEDPTDWNKRDPAVEMRVVYDISGWNP